MGRPQNLVSRSLRIRSWRDGRDLPVEDDVDGSVPAGIEAHPAGLAIEIAGGGVPALALAAVHGQLDRVAVRADEGLVPMEESLDDIFAGREVRQAPHGIAERGRVDDGFDARLEALDVDTEDELRRGTVADLKARLGLAIRRKQKQQPPVERGRGAGRGERDGEPGLGRGRGRNGEQDSQDREKRDAGGIEANTGLHGNLPRVGTKGRRPSRAMGRT
jgi:hypothetical protein